jgi:TRAP-type mannitol/chloroaromatic compound transport system substrate-binding protein
VAVSILKRRAGITARKNGGLGGGWMTIVRRNVWGAAIAASAVLAAAASAMANEPDPAPAFVLQMQTAFNPELPGAGEAVRTFAKTLKHMTGGALSLKIIEPGHVAPTRDMLDAIVSGDLEAAFTWSGYAAAKAPAMGLFASEPFGPGAEEMTSWILEGDGGRIHRSAYDKLGVVGIPCGVQGPKGGGWFRGEINTVEDFKGMRLRYGRLPGDVIERMGATLVRLPAGEFFYNLQQGKVDGGEMSTPAMDAALGFDKLGLPYYMPGWQQPSAVLDLLVGKDKWAGFPATLRAQIETACRANIAWTLGRAPHIQAIALEKLKAAGVEIRQWPAAIMEAFRKNTEIVLKARAEADPDFANAWANQKAFVAQGVGWRTMSRLP